MNQIISALNSRPLVWAIAASDSGGCAGIQADLRTLNDLGVHGCSVITALTAQNTRGISHIQASSADSLTAQFDALNSDLPAQAIKLSVITDITALELIKKQLQRSNTFCVFDPVISSSSGNAMVGSDVIARLPELYPYISLITPNRDEAALLSGLAINNSSDVIAAAHYLLDAGAPAVLIKGGHSDKHICQDYFSNGTQHFWLSNPRQTTANSRATGCTLSSAIAAFVARGKALIDALVLANAYVQQGLRLAQSIGADDKPGPLANAGIPTRFADFPQVSATADAINLPLFARCDSLNLGLYPVVDSIDWLEKLLELGVKTLQLRVKNISAEVLDTMIASACALGRQYQARLFINDYWQLAIKHGAYGVHLGQEDVATADLHALRAAGIHLGLSTHSEFEWARAATFKPSYLAIGAVFPTDTKEVVVVGTQNLDCWASILRREFPLVAIGGITQYNVSRVLATGVGSIAVVSAITAADDYQKATAQLDKKISAGAGQY